MKITIIGADIETTGLEQEKGERIIEIAMLKASYDTETQTFKLLGKYAQKFNPDMRISTKAQEVHGISIDDLTECPLWEEKAGEIAKILNYCDLFVAHNVAFDASFIVGELLRVGIEPRDIKTFCTMDNGRFATWDGSTPSLRKLCQALDITYDVSKAHGAEYDIALTMRCLFLGLKKNLFKLPENLTMKEAA